MNQNTQQVNQTPASPSLSKDISKRGRIKIIVFLFLALVLGVIFIIGAILYSAMVVSYGGSILNPLTIVFLVLMGLPFYCLKPIINNEKWAFVTITVITVILILLGFYLMLLNL